jgi:hypothetical protein
LVFSSVEPLNGAGAIERLIAPCQRRADASMAAGKELAFML